MATEDARRQLFERVCAVLRGRGAAAAIEAGTRPTADLGLTEVEVRRLLADLRIERGLLPDDAARTLPLTVDGIVEALLDEPDVDAPLPVLIGDRYELRGRLGAGGMGEVWRAYDRTLQREVAVKRLTQDAGGDRARARARFDREMRLTAAVRHPNVVAVHDWGHDSGGPYLVLELVEGRTLRELLREEGPLDPQRAIGIIRQVLDALAAVHPDIVHRDLKPENVVILTRPGTREDFAKVIDFGIARSAQVDDNLTLPGEVPCTPRYGSPERLRGAPAEGRADLWSAAVLLYELLTGRAPFDADRGAYASPVEWQAAVVHKILREDPPPAGAPPALEALLRRWLSKDPAQRPPDARAALADLDALPGPSPVAPVAPRVSRLRAWHGIVALTVPFVVAATWVSWQDHGGELDPQAVVRTQVTKKTAGVDALLATLPADSPGTVVLDAWLFPPWLAAVGDAVRAGGGDPAAFLGFDPDARSVQVLGDASSACATFALPFAGGRFGGVGIACHTGVTDARLADAVAHDVAPFPARPAAGPARVYAGEAPEALAACATDAGDVVLAPGQSIDVACGAMAETASANSLAAAWAPLHVADAEVFLSVELSALGITLPIDGNAVRGVAAAARETREYGREIAIALRLQPEADLAATREVLARELAAAANSLKDTATVGLPAWADKPLRAIAGGPLDGPSVEIPVLPLQRALAELARDVHVEDGLLVGRTHLDTKYFEEAFAALLGEPLEPGLPQTSPAGPPLRDISPTRICGFVSPLTEPPPGLRALVAVLGFVWDVLGPALLTLLALGLLSAAVPALGRRLGRTAPLAARGGDGNASPVLAVVGGLVLVLGLGALWAPAWRALRYADPAQSTVGDVAAGRAAEGAFVRVEGLADHLGQDACDCEVLFPPAQDLVPVLLGDRVPLDALPVLQARTSDATQCWAHLPPLPSLRPVVVEGRVIDLPGKSPRDNADAPRRQAIVAGWRPVAAAPWVLLVGLALGGGLYLTAFRQTVRPSAGPPDAGPPLRTPRVASSGPAPPA